MMMIEKGEEQDREEEQKGDYISSDLKSVHHLGRQLAVRAPRLVTQTGNGRLCKVGGYLPEILRRSHLSYRHYLPRHLLVRTVVHYSLLIHCSIISGS